MAEIPLRAEIVSLVHREAEMTMAGLDASGAKANTGVQVRPMSGTMGAEITGIDVSHDPAAFMPLILDAFHRYHIVVLRDQTVTSEQIYAFASQFGPVISNSPRDPSFGAVHSITNLDAEGRPSTTPSVNENYFWHSDKSHTTLPALLTMLYGVEVPPDGGDTEFSDLTRAYDALSPEMKTRLDALWVEHSWAHMRSTVGTQPVTEEERQKNPPVIHPMVRIHPETGQKCIYGVGIYCARVVGLPEEESRRLLDSVMAHCEQPEFLFRQKWKLRDLVFWDNRCLTHRAIRNYDMSKHRRILKRVVVKGKPEWVPGSRYAAAQPSN